MTHLITLVAAFAALAFPAAAAADPDAVVRDCAEDGSVDGNHSQEDKKAALKRIPADLDEYSDCRSVIAASIGGGPKAGASANGRDGAAAAAAAGGPAAKKARRKASAARRKASAAKRRKAREATELALGGRKVDPRNAAVLDADDTSNGLPAPVLLALIALGLLAVAGAVTALGKRNPGLATTLRRVPLPFGRR